MSSPAEERLERMRDEGKITPQQYEELRSALDAAEAGKVTGGAKVVDQEPGPDAGLGGHYDFHIDSDFLFRKRLLARGTVTCAIGLPIGLMMSLPFVWGLSLAGIIIGPYKFRRLMKMHEARLGRGSEQGAGTADIWQEFMREIFEACFATRSMPGSRPTSGEPRRPWQITACTIFLAVVGVIFLLRLSRQSSIQMMLVGLISGSLDLLLAWFLFRMRRWASVVLIVLAILTLLSSNYVSWLFNAPFLVVLASAWRHFFPRETATRPLGSID